MPDKSHPRRGSLGYKPQRRAPRPYPQLEPPEETGEGELTGFAGYKAGMTRILRIDDEIESPTKGQEVADAVTVLEVPPLKVYGVRAYWITEEGENPLTEVYADNVSSQLERKAVIPDRTDKDTIEDKMEEISDLRLLVHTQPWEAGVEKKKPEVFEMPIGGDQVEDKWAVAEDLLGTEIQVSDVFEPGQYVDTISITKGKGFEGPVKRHGVKTLSHKTQKSNRKAGNIGPWHPDHTRWTVPQPGGTGYNKRTELNKRVLDLRDEPGDVNPEGGFKNYGEVQNEYVIVKGSVPGPAKRLIMFRPAVRNGEYPENPEITHIES
ncbi:MAG: 50S ribosomal protein L3 [Candidatus Nanohaloarchaeota archaeon QJJ-7]|nr:50S ribosomal protein L3 [Candidatus Nanohaloarchaeota archaeon QJJ-7]